MLCRHLGWPILGIIVLRGSPEQMLCNCSDHLSFPWIRVRKSVLLFLLPMLMVHEEDVLCNACSSSMSLLLGQTGTIITTRVELETVCRHDAHIHPSDIKG